MTQFSVPHGAISGFDFIRREWRAVLTWAALRFVVSLITAGVFVALVGDDIARVAAESGSVSPEQFADPTQLWPLLRAMEPAGLIAWTLGFILQAVLLAALYRAYLHPEQRRYAYLRLGRAELVMAAVTILWWLLYFAGFFALIFLLEVLKSMREAGMSPVLGGLIGGLATFAYAAGLIWAIVRSSLAWVDSFDRNAVSLFHSLKLTRSHFWTLLGTYGLALLLTVALSLMALLAFIIVAFAAALGTGQGISSVADAMNADPATLAAGFSAAVVVWLVYSAVTGAGSYPLLFGPTADAFLAFRDRPETSDPAPAPITATGD